MKYYVNIGLVCSYCYVETEDVCCGEDHHECGFVECTTKGKEIGSIILSKDDLYSPYYKYEIIEIKGSI